MTGLLKSLAQMDFLKSDNLYLAIDQGGRSSRAMVFNHEGALLSQSQSAVAVSHPQQDWVEQDPEDVIHSVIESASDAIEKLGDDSKYITSAGLATQRSSICCWHRDTGKALSNIISWQDRRAHKWLSGFHEHAGKIHDDTGLFLSAHYGASKLRWCLDNLDEVKLARKQGKLAFGPLASFLLFRLLKERPFIVDPANASRTLLWNLQFSDWDDELLKRFGIDKSNLPVCVPTKYDYGTLEFAGKTVPLNMVNGDQSAALFAYGAIQPETAYINVGTGAFVSRNLGTHPRLSEHLLTSIVLKEENRSIYVLEGTVNGAGSALDWLEQESGKDTPYEELAEWLERDDPIPLFLNGVSGVGSPFWIADFKSRFQGEGTDWQKTVAVIESIIFLLQANIDEMNKLASPPQQIQLTGGLSRLDGLCQKLSDLAGLPVYRPSEQEATARGTAWLVAGCPAEWPEPDIGTWFKPKKNPNLSERYQAWHELMLEEARKR